MRPLQSPAVCKGSYLLPELRMLLNPKHSFPAYSQTCAGGTAWGLPLSSPSAPYQMAADLIVGAPSEHIPPQAWAAGVPGYDALQSEPLRLRSSDIF